MRENKPAAFGAGAGVGLLGGLIGLGGAEFRLPLLIGLFRFHALEAVILNKAISLMVVAAALPIRSFSVPLNEVLAWWPAILNLLAGSLIGAWIGAGWATRLQSHHLYRVIAVLLLLIALILVFGDDREFGKNRTLSFASSCNQFIVFSMDERKWRKLFDKQIGIL
ncbi:TPA: TSUP family transporter [Pseudomonas aeruginosa]